MKAQAGQEQTRASVYEALSQQAVRHGIVFHNDHLTYPDADGTPIAIYYRDIFRIITTSLYIGIMQNNGFFHVPSCWQRPARGFCKKTVWRPNSLRPLRSMCRRPTHKS